MLELLVIIEEGLLKLNNRLINKDNILFLNSSEKELLEDYKVMSREIKVKLDPSIRQKLQREGLTIIQNIYTGFDTEYKNIDLKFNEILTVQLAVSTKTMLKLPLINEYKISSLETLSGKAYPLKLNALIDGGFLLRELNKNIDRLRELKFDGYDKSIKALIEGLKNLKVPHIEKTDSNSIIFSFDRTRIKT